MTPKKMATIHAAAKPNHRIWNAHEFASLLSSPARTFARSGRDDAKHSSRRGGRSEVVGYRRRAGAGARTRARARARARFFSAAADISRAGSGAFEQVKLQLLLAFRRFLE